jgi:FeS assembly SUF system protein
MSETNPTLTESQVIAALRTCHDPEIPVNIYDLGLVYALEISPSGEVSIKMTLTAPNCPVAGSLPGQVESVVRAVAGVADVKVELVWEPPWNMSRMSDAAKLQLGMDVDYGDASSRLYGISDPRGFRP